MNNCDWGLSSCSSVPSAHPAFAVLRIAVTLLIAVHVFISAWLVATVDAAYTEGRPSPTEIDSIIAIDKDQTLIDVEIERATSLLLYTLSRDDVVVENQSNDSTSQNNTQSNDGSQASSDSQSKNRDWLEIGRSLIQISLVILVLSELSLLSKKKGLSWFRLASFSLVIFAFFIAFPTCYMLDLGLAESSDSQEDEGSPTVAENTPGNDLEVAQFAHTSDYADTGLVWLGFQLETGFSGYDLGLVEPENRTSVMESVLVKMRNHSLPLKQYFLFNMKFRFLYSYIMWFLLPAIGKSEVKKNNLCRHRV